LSVVKKLSGIPSLFFVVFTSTDNVEHIWEFLGRWHVYVFSCCWPRILLTGLELVWLAKCQFKVTGGYYVFLRCGILRCACTLKPGLSLDQIQQIWQPMKYIIYKLLINEVKPVSLTHPFIPVIINGVVYCRKHDIEPFISTMPYE